VTNASLSVLALMLGIQGTGVRQIGTTAAWVSHRLGPGSLRIILASDWRFEKRISFESERYVVSDSRGTLFVIYLGNNPDLVQIAAGKISHSTRSNVGEVHEYIRGGSVSDIVIQPRCGRDRFVWLSLYPSAVRDSRVASSMKSLRCSS